MSLLNFPEPLSIYPSRLLEECADKGLREVWLTLSHKRVPDVSFLVKTALKTMIVGSPSRFSSCDIGSSIYVPGSTSRYVALPTINGFHLASEINHQAIAAFMLRRVQLFESMAPGLDAKVFSEYEGNRSLVGKSALETAAGNAPRGYVMPHYL